ncbi:MAG: diguanylate cyclase, partial [Actinomycetota bacterium]
MANEPTPLHQAIFDVLDEGVVVRKRTGEAVAWNRRALELLGLTGPQLEGRERVGDDWELLRPGGSSFDHRPVNEIVKPLVGVFGVRHVDGSIHWLHGDTRVIEAEGRELIITSMTDVTEQRRTASDRDDATAEATRATERYRVLFDSAPVGMLEISADGVVREANAAIALILGIPTSQLVGAAAAPLFGFLGVDDLLATCQDRPGSQGFSSHEVLDGAGHPLYLLLRAAELTTDDETSWLVQVADVSEGARLEQQLRHLADHDPLTGLLNRRSFTEALDAFLARPHRRSGLGALVLIDLDNFKAINDTLGHTEGDRVITAVAEILTTRLRATDHIARLGGDEFAVLAENCDYAGARRLADDIVTAIRQEVLAGASGGKGRPVTASVGATICAGHHRTADTLVADADKALYEAKDAGRDTSVVLNETARELFRSPLSWIERVESALSDDRFELYAQPIIELDRGTTSSHELLIRMVADDGARIAPGAWIAAAERAGLFTKLDRWVVDNAIELSAAHRHPVNINLSGRSIRGTSLLRLIEETISRHDADPATLTFEVTETSAITNLAEAQKFLRELRALGCLAALDDFGKGFGSFQYLKHLPFDVIKIDG